MTDRLKQLAAYSIANPTSSLRDSEIALGLKPTNFARAFKRGTAARENEQRDYEARLAAYNAGRA